MISVTSRLAPDEPQECPERPKPTAGAKSQVKSFDADHDAFLTFFFRFTPPVFRVSITSRCAWLSGSACPA